MRRVLLVLATAVIAFLLASCPAGDETPAAPSAERRPSDAAVRREETVAVAVAPFGVPARSHAAEVTGRLEGGVIVDLDGPVAAGPLRWGDLLIVATVSELMAVDLGGGEGWSVPVPRIPRDLAAGASAVYLVDDVEVVRVDPSTGAREVIAPLAAPPSGRLTVTGGSIYVATADGVLRALDRETGAERWALRLPGRLVDRTVAAEGVLYAATSGGTVFAVNAESGAIFWQAEAGSSLAAAPAVAPLREAGAGEVVAVPTEGPPVVLPRSPDSGEPAARGEADATGVPPPVPTLVSALVHDGLLVVARADGLIRAVRAAAPAGDAVWTRTLENHLAAIPVRIGPYGVFGDAAGSVYSIDLRTGGVVGRAALPAAWTGEATWYEPLLYAATRDGRVVEISVNGPVGAAQLFDSRGSRTLPEDGRFRLRDVSTSIRMAVAARSVYEITVRCEPAEELLLSVLDGEGSVAATNMGMVVLGAGVKVAMSPGIPYLLRVERLSAGPEVLVSVSSRRVD